MADEEQDGSDGPGSQRRAPRTPRGQQTRQALLDAAERLFAEDGYAATTVPDIVKAAGVGHGTFYEHFRSRRSILLALTDQAAATSQARPRLEGTDLRARIAAEISWYLRDHVEHLALSKVWHDAAAHDAEVAATRRAERARRSERVRRGIEAASPPEGVDPAIAAAALTAMVEEFAHRWFVDGDGPGTSEADVEAAATTITAIWLAAIGAAG